MITFEVAEKVQEILKKDILAYYKKEDFNNFLYLIDTFAEYCTHFCQIMKDDTVEELLSDFAVTQIGIQHVDGEDKKVVLYDQIGTTICLGIQYLKGLVASGYEVYYVFDSIHVDIRKDLLKEIESLGVSCKIFDKAYKTENLIYRIKDVRDYIAGIKSNLILVHSPAGNSVSSSVLYSLTGIIKFRIVPGDHHYYTGVGCIDYFYEFREYGVGIANLYRGVPMDKIIRLPYYPISESFHDFQGFPSEAKDKVVILSAGSEAKFFGSNLFFTTSKKILEKYPEVVILYVGGYTRRFKNFVSKNHLEGRFLLLGYRNDFNHCMRHCDILLGSYPMCGGLISQIAAMCDKPIIAMKEDETLSMFNSLESIMGISEDMGITRSEDSGFYDYLDRLIKDKDYRKKRGAELHEKMFKENQFADRLKKTLTNPDFFTHETYRSEMIESNKLNFAEYNLRLQNERRPNSIAPLYMFYGNRFFLKFPMLTYYFIKLSVMHLSDRIKH